LNRFRIAIAAVGLLGLASVSASAAVDPRPLTLRISDMPSGFSVESASYSNVTRAAKESSISVAQYKAWG